MGKTIEITVPDIGDFTDVPVIEVLVSEGDRVEAEDSLITLESDKATMEVPAPQSGIVRDLKLKVGDSVTQGDVVALLEPDSKEPAAESGTDAGAGENAGDESSSRPDDTQKAADTGTDTDEPAQSEPNSDEADAEASPGASPATSSSASRGEDLPAERRRSGLAAVDPSSVPYASPAVRVFARELGVDLLQVSGSGDRGRILKEDVSGHVKSVMSAGEAAASAGAAQAGAAPGFAGLNLPPPPQVDFSRFGETREEPLSRIRRLSAGHLHRNWVSIPHVTQHDEADITDMESFRKDHVDEAREQGFKLTPLVFLIKASVAALKKFPQFNASLAEDGETLILKQYFNIGIAVDTPDGLVVPVLRECERKGIMELARELGELSERAREQKLKPQDIQGGCFSISSLGGIGGTAFTPIINAPEVAILGVSRSSLKPVWNGDAFQPRLMLPVSLSYDHRVIDGAAAARFTRYLCSRLEDLRRLTL
ncbi:dihydrolipoyllysine-residue acetyltransferase [Elongatibacter sediminis]|uniref:Dihydrolipoamide acetyltransferase component of pyruvate dehydrogenase complex n=1 Tax=Elongatibacter sediminis TaxID=3119006 RepID=A0AAW9RLD7_9GAMM